MLEGHDGIDNIICDDVTNEPPAEENHEELPELEITLHALTWWTIPKTMCVAAKIGSHDVIVLIDSGSTHNFISEQLANGLWLPMVSTKAFTMRIANGEKLKC